MGLNNFFSFVLLVSALMLIFIGYFSWKKEKIYVSISLIPVSIYAFAYGLEILCTSIEWARVWIKVEYLGIAFLPLAWFMFAINFTENKERIKKSTLMLLFIVPIITLIMNYTNDYHHLFYEKIYMNYDGIFPIVEIIKGPYYWLNVAYTYAVMIVGLIIFIVAYFNAVSIIRKQILLLIIAWVIPWISDIVYMLHLIPFDVDLCPLAFSFSGMISSFAILKFKLIKLTPIALEKVFSNMIDGVIILDYENNIVNFNNSSKNIISELKDVEPGEKKIDEVLKNYEMILDIVNSNSCNESLISIKKHDQLRYYNMNINNVYENTGESIGKILIFNDITEMELQRKKLSDNYNFLQTLMNAIPNPIYAKDENGIYNHCNIALTEYLGIEEEEFIGSSAYEVFETNLAQIYDKADRTLMEIKGTQVYETKLMHKNGIYRDVIFSKSLTVTEEGKDRGVVGVIIDITEQKKDQEKIEKLSKLKEAMLKIGYSINEISNINDLLQLILNEVIKCVDKKSCGSVLLLDKDNNLKIAVAKGYDLDSIKTFTIKLKDHFSWFNNGEKIKETVIFNNIDKMKDIKMLETSEKIKIKSSISSPIIVEGQLYGFLNIDSINNNFFNEGDLELMEYMRNQVALAIDKHKLYEKILYLSRYDKLTNMYNRSYFEQLVYTDIYKDNLDIKEFNTAVFDLNDLKFVNDKYGHLAGDELIKAFSKGISSIVEESDIIGRFGGDEFVGVFFNIDPQNLAYRFEELTNHFKNNPIIFQENKIICSYSYGIVKFPEEGREFDELIKIADIRMYEYKRNGKMKRELIYGMKNSEF